MRPAIRIVDRVFFESWESLLRLLIIAVFSYVGLVAILRISGKRTLSKMNAFDLVVTVALGSVLATAILSKDVPLANGLLAFALLIFFQFVITWSSVRMKWVRRVVTGEPRMIFYRGEMLESSLRKARVAEGEVEAAIRSSGIGSMSEVEAVVLETDGSFSVIRRGDAESTALEGVVHPDGLRT